MTFVCKQTAVLVVCINNTGQWQECFNRLLAIFLTLHFTTYLPQSDQLYFYCFFFSFEYFDSFDHCPACWFPLPSDQVFGSLSRLLPGRTFAVYCIWCPHCLIQFRVHRRPETASSFHFCHIFVENMSFSEEFSMVSFCCKFFFMTFRSYSYCKGFRTNSYIWALLWGRLDCENLHPATRLPRQPYTNPGVREWSLITGRRGKWRCIPTKGGGGAEKV